MIVLALDTAGADCAAALYDAAGDRVLASCQETIGKGHAERLMNMVDAIFAEAGVEREAVNLVGVTVGPGSFTGIRVGVAAARGFGLALSVPVAGVTTLEALAAQARAGGAEGRLIAAIDAKRGEVYTQVFEAAGAALTEPAALTIEDATAQAAPFGARAIGSGAALVAHTSTSTDHYDIATVARLAAARANAPGKPAPLYLRGPDAKPQTGFAIERRA